MKKILFFRRGSVPITTATHFGQAVVVVNRVDRERIKLLKALEYHVFDVAGLAPRAATNAEMDIASAAISEAGVKVLTPLGVRVHITLPIYHRQLQDYGDVVAKLREHPRLALLDSTANDDLAADRPISHGAMIRSMLLVGDFALMKNIPIGGVAGAAAGRKRRTRGSFLADVAVGSV